MTIDSRFFLAGDLQEYMVDKDTGLPLAAGILTFYEDSSRTTLKPIYTITGNPPNYSYVPLPNPLTLSGVGTVIDANGNDVVPYYFPYDGNNQPGQSKGIVDLYYITCYSSGGVLQFIRQGWPNTAAGSTQQSDITNYVPNGQFLIHSAQTNGQVLLDSSGVTYLTQGGWTFERPSSSTSVDVITFPRFNSPSSNPTTYPRYSVNVNCTTAGGDVFKYLGVRWNDVNKFASLTQMYTFAFAASSNSGTNVNVNLLLIKNFGTGGSPSSTTTTVVANFTITPSYNIYQASFVFGVNDSLSIGTNDDDYVQLAISFSGTATFNIAFTDFTLTPGTINIQSFPVSTNADFLYKSIAGWMNVPKYDGSSLGATPVLTKTGWQWDTSRTGEVIGMMTTNSPFSFLPCNGAQYPSNGYSSDGIPYSRLFNVLYNPSISQAPIFGTGNQFITSVYNSVPSNKFFFCNNSAGATTNTFDVGTGLTFYTNTPNVSIGTQMNAYLGGGGTSAPYVLCINSVVGPILNPADGASPTNFLFYMIKNGNGNTPGTFAIYNINPPAAGSYFIFNTFNTAYYVWFQKDGAGTDPAPAGKSGIKINYLTGYSTIDIAFLIASALSCEQTTLVTASSLPPNSSYFVFQTNPSSPTNYYVWVNIDGTGSDPHYNSNGIQVNIQSSFTIAQFYNAMLNAINSKFFAVPDLTGMFLRGADTGGKWDKAVNSRFGLFGNESLTGSDLGTYQLDSFLSHIHSIAATSHSHSITDVQHNHNLIVSTGAGSSAQCIDLVVTNTTISAGEIQPAFTGITGTNSTTIAASNTGYTPDISGQSLTGIETNSVNAVVYWYIRY